MKAVIIVLVVVLIALAGFFGATYNNQTYQSRILQDKVNSMQNDLDTVKANLAFTENTLSKAQSELSRTKADLTKAESSLSASQAANSRIQEELNTTKSYLQSYQGTFGQVTIKSGIQPAYTLSNQQPLNLIRNVEAKDVTWSELLTFIRQDKTDMELYVEGVRACPEIAQGLYNNAEAAGIRSALVVIKFTDGNSAHALNAFKTLDKGLVYIDCTGPKKLPYTHPTYDKIAYISAGLKLGLLELTRDDMSINYNFYIDMESKISSYEAKLQQYNKDVAGRTYYAGTPSAIVMQQRSNDLALLHSQLIPTFQLDDTTGIVSAIEIYW